MCSTSSSESSSSEKVGGGRQTMTRQMTTQRRMTQTNRRKPRRQIRRVRAPTEQMETRWMPARVQTTRRTAVQRQKMHQWEVTITTTSPIPNLRRRSQRSMARMDMAHGRKIPPGRKKTLRRRKSAPATDVTDTVNSRRIPQDKTKTKNAPAMAATAMTNRITVALRTTNIHQGTRRMSHSVTLTTKRILAKVESDSRTTYSSQIIFLSTIWATSSTSSLPSPETTQRLTH